MSMKAMILAAGRGERMRPLTDSLPKPLLSVGGKPLIVWHLERLAAAGFQDIIINHAWLGQKIEAVLADGSRWGLRIHYSPEAPGGLETAGGIATALPLLGSDPFLVINGDIWCDWNPAHAPALAQQILEQKANAWLLLADNPAHHANGDFWLAATDNAVAPVSDTGPASITRYTFTGIGIYQPRLFSQTQAHTRAALAPLLRAAMRAGQVIGQRHTGRWIDVGTPQRLEDLNQELSGLPQST